MQPIQLANNQNFTIESPRQNFEEKTRHAFQDLIRIFYEACAQQALSSSDKPAIDFYSKMTCDGVVWHQALKNEGAPLLKIAEKVANYFQGLDPEVTARPVFSNLQRYALNMPLNLLTDEISLLKSWPEDKPISLHWEAKEFWSRPTKSLDLLPIHPRLITGYLFSEFKRAVRPDNTVLNDNIKINGKKLQISNDQDVHEICANLAVEVGLVSNPDAYKRWENLPNETPLENRIEWTNQQFSALKKQLKEKDLQDEVEFKNKLSNYYAITQFCKEAPEINLFSAMILNASAKMLPTCKKIFPQIWTNWGAKQKIAAKKDNERGTPLRIHVEDGLYTISHTHYYNIVKNQANQDPVPLLRIKLIWQTTIELPARCGIAERDNRMIISKVYVHPTRNLDQAKSLVKHLYEGTEKQNVKKEAINR